MRRNHGLIVFAIALALPLVWLAATTDLSETLGGALFFVGGVMTYLWLVDRLRRARRRGELMPHRCETCGHPMAALPPGRLKPARGATGETAAPSSHRWLCRYCGRLV